MRCDVTALTSYAEMPGEASHSSVPPPLRNWDKSYPWALLQVAKARDGKQRAAGHCLERACADHVPAGGRLATTASGADDRPVTGFTAGGEEGRRRGAQSLPAENCWELWTQAPPQSVLDHGVGACTPEVARHTGRSSNTDERIGCRAGA
jgi:hypothetical protein